MMTHLLVRLAGALQGEIAEGANTDKDEERRCACAGFPKRGMRD